jgi:hypothetical protein
MSIGLEVWTLVENGYDVPKSMPIEAEDMKNIWEHAKSLNRLQDGLSKKILAKVLNCNNTKQLWNKLETIYAGDTKVKRDKLQTLKVQYEGLKMKYEENIFDVEEANFIKKLQQGSEKYKGKLPFKCFNYGKVGHFAAMCPYPKDGPEDEEKKIKQYKKKEKPNYKKKNYKWENNFYSKEENNSSSEFSDNDDDEVFFLGIEESNDIEYIKYEKDLEDESKVNMEEELLSALDELRKYKTIYRQLKSFVVEQMEKLMRNLKNQILEANRIEESL